MRQFPSLEKLDIVILYILELASSLSVLLLAFGLIASMANVLTKGAVITSHLWMQQVWAWTQCIAIDASVAGAIIRTFHYRARKEKIKMWLYAFLSGLLLFTAAIVSNIESVQQTLNIALDQAYTHVYIPLELLIWVRSIAIVCLIVAHALRHVDLSNSLADTTQRQTNRDGVIACVAIEAPQLPVCSCACHPHPVVVMEAPLQPQAQITAQPEAPREAAQSDIPEDLADAPTEKLHIVPHPTLADRKKQEAENNKQRVLAYLSDHPETKISEVANALKLSLPTVRKYIHKGKK